MSKEPDAQGQGKPKQRRNREPKWSFNEKLGYHVSFHDKDGKFQRHYYDIPKVRNKKNDEEADRQHDRWKHINYRGLKAADGADEIPSTEAPTPQGAGENLATMPVILDGFLKLERRKVRPDSIKPSRGKRQMKQYEMIEHVAYQIGQWAKQHFGSEQFQNTPFGSLFKFDDYSAMLGYFTSEVEHRRGKNGKAKKGYSQNYAKKFYIVFWRMASYAEEEPYCQRLRFTKAKAQALMPFDTASRRRDPKFPDLSTLKRLLAMADTEMRTWIWLSLGCGFEPIALAQVTRRHLLGGSSDLTRSKTDLERRAELPAVVRTHIDDYLRIKPRGMDELLFVTGNGLPLIDRRDKTAKDLAERPEAKTKHRENNALAQRWGKYLDRIGVAWHEGFNVFRHIACKVMTDRKGVSLQDVWRFMGHAPQSSTWQTYAKYITPTNRPLIDWVRSSLDNPDPDAWRDAEVQGYEEEERLRKLQAKENSKRWKKPRKRKELIPAKTQSAG